MTISKKLLFVSALICTTLFAQGVSMEGFDTSILNPYILEAQTTLDQTAVQLEDEINQQGGLYWMESSYAERLYPLQKKALKNILEKIKHSAEFKKNDPIAYKTARQLYKAFKHSVYKSWKKARIIPKSVDSAIVGRPKKSIFILE